MALAATVPSEQTRARYPDQEGYVVRDDGVRISWESYGTGEPTVLFVPPWSIVHSRCWKMQLPYFARHFRAVTYDARGNGKSDRPAAAPSYAEDEHAADLLAVMDATNTERAVMVTHSLGADRGLLAGDAHPERVLGAVFICPFTTLAPDIPDRVAHPFDKPLETDEGWAKMNAHYWRRDYRGFLEFFFSRAFPEPHSTKQIEDCVGWGLESDAETLTATLMGPKVGKERSREICARVPYPVLVMHGTEDGVRPYAAGRALAEATGGQLVTLEGSGHSPHARDPVKVNLLIREFVEQLC